MNFNLSLRRVPPPFLYTNALLYMKFLSVRKLRDVSGVCSKIYNKYTTSVSRIYKDKAQYTVPKAEGD